MQEIQNPKSEIQKRKDTFPFGFMNLDFGFTLIELLIVIAIIGVLAGSFIAFYPAAQKRARDARRESDIKQYQIALEKYANKNNGNYINASGNITGQCGAALLNIPNCPDDSITTRHYTYYGTLSPAQYVIYATLEATSSTFFVTCSNGKTGTVATAPLSSTCPL
jgi:prepilin-type N-terminal cleavage/methylation domain-containing protein